MNYKDSSYFKHSHNDKIGVLVTNLGTPDAPTPKALRKYLKQFLSDPRVVEFPRLLWWLVLNGIILRIRPARSAHAYEQVWTEQGSPLALYTESQAKGLQKKLSEKYGDNLVVEWGMRYGSPSMSSAIKKMMERGVRKLLVLPLYPQYSATTTASTFDALSEDFTKRRWIPELRFITSYHTFPAYIKALADSVSASWKEHGKGNMLVFSYHGVPLRYLHQGDPYHCQCHTTSRLLAQALGLQEGEFITTFQSRFGREPWLQPYTDETMEALGKKGIKHIQVLCPGFSSDCLETIEEIGMENRDIFLSAGGEKFEYIPALNDSDQHIAALAELAENNLQGWDVMDVDSQERLSLYNSHQHNRSN